MFSYWHRNRADSTPESWHNFCCPDSPFLAVPAHTRPSPATLLTVYPSELLFLRSGDARGPVQLCWGVTVEGIGSPTSFDLKHSAWRFFPQQSVPQAWALVVWWLTLLSRVSWYWDSFFCFTTNFLCPWESHLIYYSLNTTEKTMLFFLSTGVVRTVLLPLRGECMAPWHLDRQKNGTFKTLWKSWDLHCNTKSFVKDRKDRFFLLTEELKWL